MTNNIKHEKSIDSNDVLKIAMLSIHSSPVGELGTSDTGGMSVYIRELAEELGKTGVSTDIFTLCQNRQSSSITSLYKNVRLIYLNIKTDQPIIKETLFDYLPSVFDAFNETVTKDQTDYDKAGYDLIHSHYWLSGVLGNQIKQKYDLPHIITFHTTGAVKNRFCTQELEPDFRIEKEKGLTAACDRIVASTQNEAHDLISLYNAESEKISVVPAGVNLELFKPLDKTAACREIDFNDDAKLLLYVGRHVPIKGLDRLLKTISEIRNKISLRLLVIGGDDENEKLKSTIKDLNIQKEVDLSGRKDQKFLPAYYSAADMLVVPSYHESFCLAGLESLACGTPVVSTPVGIMPTIINNKNGCILTENNDSAMAEAILRVANNHDRGNYSPAQIRNSVKDYSWANTAELMLGEYHRVISNFDNKKGEGK
ncbi:MAG: glycosyltransferase [Desulfobacteraceae bacterium]|nr:glycosyltransferase [Desulfobacteraceae bacterium]